MVIGFHTSVARETEAHARRGAVLGVKACVDWLRNDKGLPDLADELEAAQLRIVEIAPEPEAKG